MPLLRTDQAHYSALALSRRCQLAPASQGSSGSVSNHRPPWRRRQGSSILEDRQAGITSQIPKYVSVEYLSSQYLRVLDKPFE